MRQLACDTIIWAFGIWALYASAPSFRPKFLHWIAKGFWGPRGVALLAFLGVLSALFPLALRLKREKISCTVMGGTFILLALLYEINFIGALESDELGRWSLRLALLGIGAWGWLRRDSREIT